MQVIPAIDILEGRCVRLLQGNFAKKTIYSNNPEAVAYEWACKGAERIHVVDLDGALSGLPTNMDIVSRIVSAVDVPIQLGGGIRTVEAAIDAVQVGVDRVMVGTAAIDKTLLLKISETIGIERVLVSLDARDGEVMVEGWTASGGMRVTDVVSNIEQQGVSRIMYTDVTRDGTLTEPNFEAIDELVSGTQLSVIAAGGIASVDHLIRLSELGVEGAVVGRALYTGDVELADAIIAVEAL